MECLAGDTIGPMHVSVQDNDTEVDVSDLSMRLIVAKKNNPAIAVLVKECTQEDGKFSVSLTSTDTAYWHGSYLMHFALYDGNGLIYRKLAGEIWVHAVPKGGTV